MRFDLTEAESKRFADLSTAMRKLDKAITALVQDKMFIDREQNLWLTQFAFRRGIPIETTRFMKFDVARGCAQYNGGDNAGEVRIGEDGDREKEV